MRVGDFESVAVTTVYANFDVFLSRSSFICGTNWSSSFSKKLIQVCEPRTRLYTVFCNFRCKRRQPLKF